MSDIFLSYSHQDRDVARRYADALQAAGQAVWWDDHLRSGEAFDEKIEAALRAAKAVVVLWSPRSVTSRWVRAEATLADRKGTLLPVMIEPCERPIMFELTQTAELCHWQGDATDNAWVAFMGDVGRFVGREAVAPVAPVSDLPAPAPATRGRPGEAPSLAVLPFTNRSSLPEDEVFAEGMVEDVISALSQGVNVRVLGSTSTAHLRKGAATDLSAVGRQLGVSYLLEGNVRRAGADLRVTTQLMEAATGAVMWTAKFDRPLAELAALQEELVTDVAASLDAQVYSLEMQRVLKKPSDITAWEAVVRAMSAYRQPDPTALQRGIDEAARAVAIAPDYAPGHAMLAGALATAYVAKPDEAAEVQRIRAIAERALALAPDDASVLGTVGEALSYVGYPEEAERHTGRAVRKAPGSGLLNYYHGKVCAMLNRPEEALSHLKTAERLMPGWHVMYALKLWQSTVYREMGRWAEADGAIDEVIRLVPTPGPFHVHKAYCCLQLGRDAEARRLMETARRSGAPLVLVERLWRRFSPNSSRLEADIAIIRALYAATEPDA